VAQPWAEYQSDAASLFRALGLDAETDVTVQGVRTRHQIDVLVKSHHVGFDIVWLVECKDWQTRVSKLHVLALREIVADVGADRGILLCEVGFQSGALEAAQLTNVHLSSLDDLRHTASAEISAMRLRELYDRVEACRLRYWDIPKDLRIKHGLRSEVGAVDYSGAAVIELVTELLTKAFRAVFPIQCESLLAYITPGFPDNIVSVEEVLGLAEPLIAELERRFKALDERAD